MKPLDIFGKLFQLALTLLLTLVPLHATADTWNAGDYFKTLSSSALTPDKPYLEFQILYRDYSGIDDEVRDMNYYLSFKGKSDLVQIYHYGKGRDSQSSCTLSSEDYGVVNYQGSWESGDKEYGKFRFYPSEKAFKDGLQALVIKAGWDVDEKGRTSYSFTKTFDISMSRPDFSHHLRRTASQTLSYSISEESGQSANTLTDYVNAGYSLDCRLYSDAYQRNLVFEESALSPATWHPLSQRYANDAAVTLHVAITLTHTLAITNAKGTKCSLSQNMVYKVVPISLDAMAAPKDVRAATDLWKKRITISWGRATANNQPDAGSTATDRWNIYRRSASQTSQPYTLVASQPLSSTTWNDEGNHLDYDSIYSYIVARMPDNWGTENPPQGVATELQVGVKREIPITLTATPSDADIRLNWTHPAIKTSDASAAFRVMYSVNGDDNWREAATVPLRSTTATSHEYVHSDITSSCDVYTYRVDITQLGATFTSPTVTGQISGTSHVSRVHASKGSYPSTVRVEWEAEQYGTTPTHYEIYRRSLGTTADWGRPIHTVSGTMTQYVYDDTNVAIGAYYEYKVTSQTICTEIHDNSDRPVAFLLDDGFCQSAGSIGGQITYGSGSAVSDVRVVLEKNDDTDTTPMFYSLRVGDEMGGVIVSSDETLVPASQPFSVQLWASPDIDAAAGGTVIDIPGKVILRHSPSADNSHCNLELVVPTAYDKNGAATTYEVVKTDINIPEGEYAHLTLAYDGTGLWTLSHVVNSDEVKTFSHRANTTSPTSVDRLAFGYATTSQSSPFSGYIDELRLWRRALTSSEILRDYDRILSGQEADLGLYIPIDEGINQPRHAYDYSVSDGVAGEHHGDIYSGTISSYVPSQLHLYGLTDSNGNYLIRGVPFNPSGTNYTMRPVMGTHEFSPMVQSRYVSATSAHHNSVNFTDSSSFTVEGDVHYAGTTIPVEGANLYVDGNPCNRDGQIIQTDEDGRYSIEVPIGNHFIEIRKTGHTFSDDGFWPTRTDANVTEKHYFDQPLKNRRFYDTTLVPVVGRVCGGAVQDSIAVSCGASVNNIGVAELVLSVGKASLNVVRDDLGISHDATSRRDFEVAPEVKEWVNSTAWVEGGSFEQTSRLHILTDAATGEFSAMLPPCDYKVESVRLTGPNPEGITFSDCPRLDATQVSLLQTDTITVENQLREAPYVASYKLFHRNPAEVVVTEVTNFDRAFGDSECDVYDLGTDTEEIVPLYSVDDADNVTYHYGHPIYTLGREYEYNIHASERYVNYDGERPVTYEDVLAGAEVEVTNQFCGEQVVLLESGALTDSLNTNKLTIDSEGNVRYRFVAGYPNITSPYTRTLNIIVKRDGSNIEWSENGKFEAIIFGGLPTGNNFITQGPSQMFMVLHDPPGTNSSTTFSEGATFSVTHSASHKAGGGYTGSKDFYMGLTLTTATGLGMLLVDSKEAKSEINTKEEAGYNYSYESHKSYTITTTTAISTSSNHNFVGSKGDVYYGASYNNIYGKMRCVGLYRNAQGTYDLKMVEEMGIGNQFATTFAFSQFDILYRVIPELEEARNNALLYDPNYVPGQPYTRSVKEKPIFITSLQPGDKGYGTLNTDREVWGDAASNDPTMGPSFIMVLPDDAQDGDVFENSVANYITYIKQWQQAIAQNEEAKVNAIESGTAENVSVSSGANYSASASLTYSEGSSSSHSVSVSTSAVLKWGFRWNRVGLISTDGVKGNYSYTNGGGDSHSNSVSFSYNMGVGAPDRLSVDVYKPVIAESRLRDELDDDSPTAPRKLLSSPIFVTRGGVTHDPYQGEERTMFHKPGRVINEATMAHEKPSITVTQDHITGLAAGSKVTFEVHLVNESESGDDVRYNFAVVGSSTVGQPLVTLDGLPFTSATYTLSPGQDLIRYIVLQQTDLSQTICSARLMLASTSQNDPTSPVGRLADFATITAEFLPTSSPSTLTAPHSVVNTVTGTVLPLTIGGYDPNFEGLRGFELLYRYEGEADYTSVAELPWEGASIGGASEFTHTIDMTSSSAYPDGTYTFIVRSYAGPDGAIVSRDSEPLVIVKDTQRPAMVGNPSPANFLLGPNDVISVQFSEDIERGRIARDNIVVTGRLNGTHVDHSAALQFDGSDAAPVTSQKFNLTNHDFAGEAWVLVHRSDRTATIFQHGVEETGFSIDVDPDGHLALVTQGDTIRSAHTIDFDRWFYLACSYAGHDDDEANHASFSAQIATDEGTRIMFDDLHLTPYSTDGPIEVGRGLHGAIHELSFWNRRRTPEESFSECHLTKQLFTPGLVAYWPMNEGTGNVVHDYIHAYDFTAPHVDWYCAAPNCALSLDGASHIDYSLDATDRFAETDNYTIEAWVRADAQQATLIDVADGTLRLDATADGTLAIATAGGHTFNVGTLVFDQNWHHIALNVRRAATTYVYIDGEEQAQLESALMPTLRGQALTLGAARSQSLGLAADYSRHFTGDMDEVRLWKSTLTANSIRLNMRTRLDTLKTSGLMLYLPFEETADDITTFTLADKSPHHVPTLSALGAAQAASWPALKAIPQLQQIDYDYVVTERTITIRLKEEPARLHGNPVYVTLRGIYDLNGNVANDISWNFYNNLLSLHWNDTSVDLLVDDEEDYYSVYRASFTNTTSRTIAWRLGELPQWIVPSASAGIVEPFASESIEFMTVAPCPTMSVIEAINLYDEDGICYCVPAHLYVYKKRPDWTFAPDDYDSNMILVAKVYAHDRLNDNGDSMLAAFCDGHLVGLASPIYVSRYDSYYVPMTIYGNADMEGHPIKFKFWDAKTDIIYSPLTYDAEPITFVTNAFHGTYAQPVNFRTTTLMEQEFHYSPAWTWTSISLDVADAPLASLLDDVSSHVALIKTQSDGFDMTDEANDYAWSSRHVIARPGTMYMVQVRHATDHSIIGNMAHPTQHPIPIAARCWNWIGYIGTQRYAVKAALSGLHPTDGDIIKSQDKFAIYNGDWDGTLTQMVPGEGYMYYSAASTDRTLVYPDATTLFAGALPPAHLPTTSPVALPSEGQGEGQVFTPVPTGQYSDNMTLLAQVLTPEGSVVETGELAVFAGSECRASAHPEGGRYYLTIPGDAVVPLTFRYHDGTSERAVAPQEPLTYRSNTHHGTPAAPYTLTLADDASAIGRVTHDAAALTLTATADVVTLHASHPIHRVDIVSPSGRVLSHRAATGHGATIPIRPLSPGVYYVRVTFANGTTAVRNFVKM